VSSKEVRIRSASLGGIRLFYLPLRNVTSTECGYQRSIWAFAFAIYFLASATLQLIGAFFITTNGTDMTNFMASAFGSLILAVVAGVIYFLSHRIQVSMASSGGVHSGLVFKRSVIENVSVDLAQAMQAVNAINERVQAGQHNSLQQSAGAQLPEVRQTTKSCPQCSTANPIDSRFCEACGMAMRS
jgi:hypothetical protein